MTTIELAATLSPTKLGKFVSCPLAFKYSYIDRIPEPATTAQLRGTLVHRALQRLFLLDAEARTVEAAHDALDEAWSVLAGEADAIALGLEGVEAERFVRDAHRLIDRYFRLEDPTTVTPVGIELDLRADLDGVQLRGIIDRLDRCDDGRFVVTDYKTGRSPMAGRARSRLGGVLFYAHLCESVIGVRPSEVRLVYLGDEVVVVEEPTDQAMRGVLQRTRAVWSAIGKACESDDFRPNPSALCRYCSFTAICPAAPK